ncbi:MAG: DUF1761 domain-containing protein [bacterium]|nr:DUF1761 domain-containing protein [bacterium]
MFFQNINYWIIITASIVGMIVGFIWYAPWAFGKLWMKSKNTPIEKPKTSVWIGMTISTFITAFVLAALFNSLVIVSFWGLVLTAFLLWIGFTVPMKLGDYYFGTDSFTFFLLSVGHELALLTVMSLIIGIFG